ncbi:MAG: AbrB/MazE/SpoVT family DNA-binding domain-containing protein [Actinomycetes bacterium]
MEPKVKTKAIRKGRSSTSRISSKNQVTIPVEIMRMSGLEAGEEVEFSYVEGKVLVEKAVPKIAGLFGIGNGITDNFDWEKERAEAWGE